METHIISESDGMNGKVIGSLLIGIVSLFGIFLVQQGSLLSLVGLLLASVGLIEIKQRSQKGYVIALLGLVLNSIGILSFIIFYL